MLRALVLLGMAAALLSGCSEEPPSADATEAPGPTADCGAVETVPIQGEGHLVGDQAPPVPYNSTPPTSGWHTATDVSVVIAPQGEPLTEPEQVTILETGGVVVTHNGLDAEQRDELERFISDNHAGVAALTSYDKLEDGAVALTAWGRVQQCEAVDTEAITAFIAAYAQR